MEQDESQMPAGGERSMHDQTPQPQEAPSVESSAAAEAATQAESTPPEAYAPPVEPPPPLEPEPAHEPPRDEEPEPAEAAAGPESEPHMRGRVEIGVITGDAAIRGGASEVQIDTHDRRAAETLPHQQDGTIRIPRLPDGSEVWVPDGYEVIVRQIEGDLRASLFDGMLQINNVDGDASISGVNDTRIAHVSGDLKATRGNELRVRVTDGDARIESYSAAPLLGEVRGDLRVFQFQGLEVRGGIGGDAHIEQGRSALIGAVGGDLEVEDLDGSLFIEAVGGDASLTGVQQAAIGTVGGDLDIQAVHGPLDVNTVGGDSDLRRVQGRARVNVIGGDLQAVQAPGGITVTQTGGDVTLDTVLGAGAEYTISAAGDILLRTRGEVNARFVAQTFGGEIQTRLPLTVERGRRRNLVGVLGRGDASVTLRSMGGDITIVAADWNERAHVMSDDTTQQTATDQERDEKNSRTYEANFGRQRFRVRVDRGEGRTGVYFQGPYGEEAEAESGQRDFGFEWEKGRGPRTYGEYEERLNDLRDKAEQVARKAADQAQKYAEKAAQRARETDWQAVGREVRSSIEKAMADLEDAFGQVRREWETRRPPESGGSSRPSAQRVRIEQDDEEPASESAAYQSSASQDERDAQRRSILEQLRTGALSIDEAERRLNELR